MEDEDDLQSFCKFLIETAEYQAEYFTFLDADLRAKLRDWAERLPAAISEIVEFDPSEPMWSTWMLQIVHLSAAIGGVG